MNNLKRLLCYAEYHRPLQGRESSSHIDFFIYKIGCTRRVRPCHRGEGLFSLFRSYSVCVNTLTNTKSTHCIPITYRAMHIFAIVWRLCSTIMILISINSCLSHTSRSRKGSMFLVKRAQLNMRGKYTLRTLNRTYPWECRRVYYKLWFYHKLLFKTSHTYGYVWEALMSLPECCLQSGLFRSLSYSTYFRPRRRLNSLHYGLNEEVPGLSPGKTNIGS